MKTNEIKTLLALTLVAACLTGSATTDDVVHSQLFSALAAVSAIILFRQIFNQTTKTNPTNETKSGNHIN